MKHVENRDVAGKLRERSAQVLRAQIHFLVFGNDSLCGANFSQVAIETDDRIFKTALAQIKTEQSEATAHIKQWRG